MSEVKRVLVVSTGHISKATADLLDAHSYVAVQDRDKCFWPPMGNGDDMETFLPATSYRTEYGWYFYVGDDAVGAMPDLQALYIKAKRENCSWIELDCDGPDYDDLPRFEW